MIAIIAALTPEGIIGRANALPANVPEEMAHFHQLTTGHTVIMGRRTYASIGHALPDRFNIVVSHTVESLPGCTIAPSIPEALALAKQQPGHTFFIGGASVFEQAIPLADTMYLSYLKENYPGDVHFPLLNPADWQEVSRQEFKTFTFATLRRIVK